MDKLKKDNDTLKEELALETKQAMASNSSAAAAQIAKLQDQADTYTRKIEMEKRRIEELDKQIEAMEKNILSQRKKMGGVNAAKENHAQIQKQIKILENRLEKVRSAPARAALTRDRRVSLVPVSQALQKFNEALAHNKQLRETIDNLRRERVVFDQIYKKLVRARSPPRYCLLFRSAFAMAECLSRGGCANRSGSWRTSGRRWRRLSTRRTRRTLRATRRRRRWHG